MADERRDLEALRALADDIRRQTADWPSSMRAPEPGSDLMWEKLMSGGSEPAGLTFPMGDQELST